VFCFFFNLIITFCLQFILCTAFAEVLCCFESNSLYLWQKIVTTKHSAVHQKEQKLIKSFICDTRNSILILQANVKFVIDL